MKQTHKFIWGFHERDIPVSSDTSIWDAWHSLTPILYGENSTWVFTVDGIEIDPRLSVSAFTKPIEVCAHYGKEGEA